jgi:hypothetical protein
MAGRLALWQSHICGHTAAVEGLHFLGKWVPPDPKMQVAGGHWLHILFLIVTLETHMTINPIQRIQSYNQNLTIIVA